MTQVIGHHTPEKLKPCPFCNGYPELWERYDFEDNGTFHVLCMNYLCGASGGYQPSAPKAVAVWNQRSGVMQA